jgi:hypothetical protein
MAQSRTPQTPRESFDGVTALEKGPSRVSDPSLGVSATANAKNDAFTLARATPAKSTVPPPESVNSVPPWPSSMEV